MKNNELYHFLLRKTWQLTEQWYESLDKSNASGVYASQDPKVINTLKQQNYEFHLQFCNAFNEEISTEQFYKEFEEWVMTVAGDEQHLRTPIPFILKEFFRVQEQYLDLVEEFIQLHEDEYSDEHINTWNRTIVKNFNLIIAWFTQESYHYAELKLKSQQELINQLSSPVICLNDDVALLPLIGDIDRERATFLLENTLKQCTKLNIHHLLIDLSGVVKVDTMVALQIYQLIKALSLINVDSTLSGIRPEIAKTAVQLGIDFNKIPIVSTLKRAIKGLV
ncbi:STAS domain-containing protein [Bacillus sp. UNC438CL73TsuS30]|uniref:STAS domain-containing protein n=1 Tax=Bacillus sp. UNC438CL73TsuS30 TaxID=1340434 RepID=UPI00047D775A|nr:STAS domain-containing protein [Bacillus sp. UNC438CL73TsuS30]